MTKYVYGHNRNVIIVKIWTFFSVFRFLHGGEHKEVKVFENLFD